MICELGTMLHCSMYGSYKQPVIIHERNVAFICKEHGSPMDVYFEHVYGRIDERTGRLGCIVTFCDMWTNEWEKMVWMDQTYILDDNE